MAKVGAIECLAFSDGHLPLSNMHLNLLHVFLWLDKKISPAQISLSGFTSLCIHSFTY